MTIFIESRRKKLEAIKASHSGAMIVDVTSKGPGPWVQFSPFFPHGGIPIPNSGLHTGQSVEGIWQGLKVFEKEDIDPSKWAITNMKGSSVAAPAGGRSWDTAGASMTRAICSAILTPGR